MTNLEERKKKTFWDKLEIIHKLIRVGFIVILPVYVLGVTVYKGTRIFGLSLFEAIITGAFLGLIIFFILLVMDFGFLAWDQSTVWFSKQWKKYPTIRKILIFPVFLGIVLSSFYYGILYWPWDNFFRFIFLAYFGFAFPSALLSILIDEKARKLIKLSKHITPDLIVGSPQAAIESAFTYFEDYLRKRLEVGAEIYGEELINLAFGKEGKLIYSEVDNENRGVRNFISGAYSTFRNPRKHRIVQDDEKTVLVIIDIVELLIRIVDESKEREQASNQIK